MAGSVQLSVDDKVVRVHAARHGPAKEHGAFAMPKGEPRKAEPSLAGSECRPPTGTRVLCGYRELTERSIPRRSRGQQLPDVSDVVCSTT